MNASSYWLQHVKREKGEKTVTASTLCATNLIHSEASVRNLL